LGHGQQEVGIPLILDLEEGDFSRTNVKGGKTAKFQDVLFGSSDQS
jgi:hypothetical protein